MPSIASLITTSRLQIEAALDLALITQSWRGARRLAAAARGIELPLRPVQSVEAVRITSEDDVTVTLESWRYLLDGAGVPARIVSTATRFPTPGAVANGIEIAFTAGYGATLCRRAGTDPPGDLLLIAHWFECRGPSHDGRPVDATIPAEISALLDAIPAGAAMSCAMIGALRHRVSLESRTRTPEAAAAPSSRGRRSPACIAQVKPVAAARSSRPTA